MTDAEYEVQKARVQAVIDRWVGRIGLTWWRINWNWRRETLPDVELAGGAGSVMADCKAWWQYMEATINVYLPAVADFEDERLEYFIVHELAHVLLSEMRDATAGDGHEERAATSLARALIWAREAGYDDGLTAQPERALQEA